MKRKAPDSLPFASLARDLAELRKALEAALLANDIPKLVATSRKYRRALTILRRYEGQVSGPAN